MKNKKKVTQQAQSSPWSLSHPGHARIYYATLIPTMLVGLSISGFFLEVPLALGFLAILVGGFLSGHWSSRRWFGKALYTLGWTLVGLGSAALLALWLDGRSSVHAIELAVPVVLGAIPGTLWIEGTHRLAAPFAR